MFMNFNNTNNKSASIILFIHQVATLLRFESSIFAIRLYQLFSFIFYFLKAWNTWNIIARTVVSETLSTSELTGVRKYTKIVQKLSDVT